MSYAQFLAETPASIFDRDDFPCVVRVNGRQVAPRRRRCMQELYVDQEGDVKVTTPSMMPDHRADEAYVADPVFDNGPDTFQPAPEGLTPLQQIEFQDLYKKAGRVIGRHDAVVDMPWYLTQQFVTRKLQCSPQEASDLLDALKALEANHDAVLEALAHAKSNGVQVSVAYYQGLAAAMQALDVSSDDAMEHRPDGLAHVAQDFGSYDSSPEWAMLLDEGVPSAASIAHSLGVSLEIAGDIREDMILQDYEAAASQAEAAVEDAADDDELDVEPDDDQDYVGFVSEGWHLMDDKDDYGPTWLQRQPYEVQALFTETTDASSLKELKALGQKVYSLTSWSPSQRSAFWSAWHARRNALLAQTEARMPRVRKGAAKILSVDAKELPRLGKRLYDLLKSNRNFYPDEGWAVLWNRYHERKVEVKTQPAVDRRALVAQFLEAHAR
jgi:hypothetical protein